MVFVCSVGYSGGRQMTKSERGRMHVVLAAMVIAPERQSSHPPQMPVMPRALTHFTFLT